VSSRVFSPWSNCPAAKQGALTVVDLPDYQRVIDDITKKVAAGTLKPGDALPSIAQMATLYDTSQSTVKVALAVLRAQGIIRGHQGKGTYIAETEKPAT
jgi:GntR family transcriptional regulator